MMFQCPGGVTVPGPSAQNRAISDCSAVRVALSERPSSDLRLKSKAHWALSSPGGGGGRNCEPLIIAKGVTCGQLGRSAGASAGGVGTQIPGPLPGVYSTAMSEPSSLRNCRIAFATNSPQEIPTLAAGPSVTPPRLSAYAMSKASCWAGKRRTNTVWAAAAMAASFEATPAGLFVT